MSTQPFLLSSFSKNNPNDVIVSGNICRNQEILSITYELAGTVDKIRIPYPEKTPVREDRLWESTCFELFLSIKQTAPYWEFNLSPSGHWNVYRFDDYRKNMAEEPAFSQLPFTVTRQPGLLNIELKINLEKIVPPKALLQAGISAVICDTNGDITYRALTHPEPSPDFHHPSGFVLEL